MKAREGQACLVALLLTLGRGAGAQEGPAPLPPSGPAAPPGDTPGFLRSEGETYRRALAAARRWLDGLEVDPLDLRAHGIKGKKKLVEILDAYYRLFQISPAGEREGLLKRIRSLTSITHQDRYHDMLSISDQWFKEDATSYLRAALLMERLGLDTARYRAEILKAKPRLDAHLRQRGPNQRRIFHWYYRHFGLEEPFPLGDALQAGLIARRADHRRMSAVEVYDLTHEVFGPYEFGERLDLDPFSPEDKRYLRGALEGLTARFVRAEDPDLTAELVSCLRYLRFVDLPVYRQALGYLLRSQNRDGSFGVYDGERKRLGDYVQQGLVLHTTLVALEALTVAFHEPWNPP